MPRILLATLAVLALAGCGSSTDPTEADTTRTTAPAPEPPAPSNADGDPFERIVETFPIKEPPLYVRQIQTFRGSHQLFAAVDLRPFCLLTAEARRTAVQETYRKVRPGVRDFSLIVVPFSGRVPTTADALAVGEDGSVRLTPRGRDC